MSELLRFFNDLNEESRTIFSLLQKRGPLTKNGLLVITKLKLTTLNRIMKPLLDRKIIVEAGIGKSTGGRKPVLYDINDSRYYLVGIDISRTYTELVITNLKMNIKFRKRFSMDSSFSPEKTIAVISKVFCEALKQLNIGKDVILGVGVGTVGPLDREKGVMTSPRNFLSPGWRDVPVKRILESAMELPVFIDNGANTAVLAEFLYGSGKDFKNIAYFNCGIGIRTGAISSSTIIRTINDAEDLFGHMIVDVDGEPCSCGNYGCVECYSSILAITKRFISELKKGRCSLVSKEIGEINYVDICEAAKRGDELAREVISNAAAVFGSGMANYINLLGPRLVILSGPLIKHSNLFFRVSTDVAVKKCFMKDKNKITFCRGGFFGDDAIAVGAAAMVVEKFLNSRVLG